MTTTPRNVIIVGSGPAGLTAGDLRRPGQPRPARHRGRAVEHERPARRPADADHRRRELPRLPRRDHGARADAAASASRPSASAPSSSPRRRPRSTSPARPFQVWVRDTVYEADAVIVSTGARSLMLGLEAESRLLGHGLSTCATCDGFFFRGQHIAVVGGGDSALEEAHLPHQVRRQGHRDPPPRRAAGVEDHAGPGVRQPEDRVPVGHRRRRPRSATDRLEGAVVRNVHTGADLDAAA